MRWVPFLILAYVALGLQIGIAPFVKISGVAPNLPLIAAVFIALHAPREIAMMGCFAIGFLQDMLTQQPPGLYAISYGLVAMVVGGSQSSVYGAHPVTHLFMTAIGASITAVVIMLHALLHPSEHRLTLSAHGVSVLYTALLAPVVVGLRSRARRIFAFHSPRRRVSRI